MCLCVRVFREGRVFSLARPRTGNGGRTQLLVLRKACGGGSGVGGGGCNRVTTTWDLVQGAK